MSTHASSSQIPSASGERKLAAIIFTDIVGFSRQMGVDEARTLRVLAVHNQLIQHAVTDHHGSVVNMIAHSRISLPCKMISDRRSCSR